MYMGVLSAMSVHYMHAVTTQARRVHWIPSGWNFRQLGVAMWVLGIEPRVL